LTKYYQRILVSAPEVQLIKCFDKFDNIFSLCLNPSDDVRKEYLDGIERYEARIAERFLPQLVPYLKRLIENARKIGYFYPVPSSL